MATYDADGKLIKENKCMEDFPTVKVPNISYGTSLPSNSSGAEGDVFILLED